MGTEIVVNTYKLENYAQKLNKVCMRISSVNSQLQRVYWRVNGDEESLVEAQRLRAVLNANTLLRYRDNLKKCVSYLNETASDFEETEQDVIKKRDNIYTAIITGEITCEDEDIFDPTLISGNICNTKDFSQDKMVVYLRNNSSYDTDFWKFNYFATFLGERNDFLDSLKISWAKGTDIITGFFTGKSYEEQIMKKSLSGILQNVSNNDIETTEIPDEVKYIVKILKEGGDIKELHLSEKSKKSNIYKHLIENEEFYKGMGKVSKAIKNGELTTEYVEYLLTDYSKNVEYLETLKAGLDSTEADNAVLLKVVDDLQTEYSNKWAGTFVKTYEKAIEKGVDELINLVPTGRLYSLVDLGKDIANEITGLNDEVDSLESLYGMHQYSNDLISSYDYYADKIRSGDFTEDDLTRCKNLFELTKSAKIEEYQAMIDLTKDSSQKKVLEKEMQQLNNMSYTTSWAGSGGGRF